VKIKKTFLAVLAFVITMTTTLYAQEGLPIHEIKIKGNKRIGTPTIAYYIKSEVGQPLSKVQIRKDIEQIYSLNQFKNVQVETELVGNGVDVVFNVEEIPSVGPVRIVGNDKIETKDILAKLAIKRGATFSDHLIQDGIEQVTKLYHDKGYFFVSVKIDSFPTADNLADVVVRIIEGEKVGIENLKFNGNKTFTAKEISTQMEIKERGLLSWFDESGIYKKDNLRLDLLRIEAFYHDHGFLRVRVLEPQIEINKKKREMYITIGIEEGVQYKVSKVDVKGDDTFTTEELRTFIKTKEGEIYNEAQIRQDVVTLTEKYSSKGFAYADVNPNSVINDKDRTVSLSLHIDKAKKVYIGSIEIAGNMKTRDNVIRREFRLKEGDLFDSEKLKRSKQRITNLNFFEDVKIDTKRGKDPELIDVATTVTEKPTGSISIGGGFSSVENFIFNGSVSQDNFLGRGQKLIFSSSLSSIRTNYNLTFTDPRIFDSEVMGGVDIFRREGFYFSFTSLSDGLGLRFGRNLGEYDWLGLNYRYEHTTVSDVADENVTPFLFNQFRTTSRISPSFIHDTRDDFLNPSNGWRHVVRFEIAGGILGGLDFHRTNYEVTYYHPIFQKLVGAIHVETNYADGYNGTILPIFERYFMGGANSLRGYTIRNVGPKNANGDPLGGTQTLLMNFEAQYPFTKSLRGILFYDRGNVYGTGPDISGTSENFEFGKMRQSVGTGIRFISPFGPIGVSYGVKTDRRDGERVGEFHFSAGSSF
jgi:outer membrane protein insertion porin family